MSFPRPNAPPTPSADTESLIRQLTDDTQWHAAMSSGQETYSPPTSLSQSSARAYLSDAIRDMRDEQRNESITSDPLRPPPLTMSNRNSPKASPVALPPNAEKLASWGDYSENDQFGSPVRSIPSFKSWASAKSRTSSRVPRSMSRSSRSEPNLEGRPLDSPMTVTVPLSPERAPSMFSFDESREPKREARGTQDVNLSSYGGRIEPLGSGTPVSNHELTSLEPLDRCLSTATKNTIPLSLFRDFDGVHLTPLNGRHLEEKADVLDNRPGDELETELRLIPRYTNMQYQEQQRWAEPPPQEGMVYYPAPVPRNLNMPQRLSQQPPSRIRARRRSQVLGAMPVEARRSMLGLFEEPERSPDRPAQTEALAVRAKLPIKRKSVGNLKNLPPQLRASVFFDHPSIPHEIEVKRQSAVATLEDMLDASADAPVDAFMGVDDTHTGRGRPTSSKSLLLNSRPQSRMSRGSLLSMPMDDWRSGGRASQASMLSGKRSTSVDNLGRFGDRTSRASMLSGKRSPSVDYIGEHAKRHSALSLGDEIKFVEVPGDAQAKSDAGTAERMQEDSMLSPEMKRASSVLDEIFHLGGEPEPEPEIGDETRGDEEDEASEVVDEQALGPPTTLLAELQLRKLKLKQRTRTAATAFPNGMHSTLLQLEEVAQVEKRRRRGKPTTLAWEDPSARGTAADINDENVPLGILFPERNGLLAQRAAQSDWDKPLGLIEHRARENNETLGQRRNRLLGVRPGRQHQGSGHADGSVGSSPNPQQHSDGQSDHEGDTLARRTRRLRSKKALDDAIGGGANGAQNGCGPSNDFSSDMMSQFAPLDTAETAPAPPAHAQTPQTDPNDETLGQRRRRLQAERDASGTTGRQPEARPHTSLSNMLAATPGTATNSRHPSAETGISNSGLQMHDQLAYNANHTQQPQPQPQPQPQSQTPQPPHPYTRTQIPQQGWGIAPQTFSRGFGAISPQQSPYPVGSMLWQQQQHAHQRKQSGMMPGQYSGQLAGTGTYAAGAMPVPVPGSRSGSAMGMGMGVLMGANRVGGDIAELSPVQKDNIDRWRMSVLN